jgi:hypothetical protein
LWAGITTATRETPAGDEPSRGFRLIYTALIISLVKIKMGTAIAITKIIKARYAIVCTA